MKAGIDVNRARMLRAALEATRHTATALIEFLEKGVIANPASAEIDGLIAQLGGGDAALIETLDDALDTLAIARNDYIYNACLELGDAAYKVK